MSEPTRMAENRERTFLGMRIVTSDAIQPGEALAVSRIAGAGGVARYDSVKIVGLRPAPEATDATR